MKKFLKVFCFFAICVSFVTLWFFTWHYVSYSLDLSARGYVSEEHLNRVFAGTIMYFVQWIMISTASMSTIFFMLSILKRLNKSSPKLK